ncbi:MAG: carboxypeptidase regulatory-like domain-containing protein [Planctomycetes bacterium]|nr:carboxypeptidase regulatory-like domain-containing protein [Planctomycetota bacterium]
MTDDRSQRGPRTAARLLLLALALGLAIVVGWAVDRSPERAGVRPDGSPPAGGGATGAPGREARPDGGEPGETPRRTDVGDAGAPLGAVAGARVAGVVRSVAGDVLPGAAVVLAARPEASQGFPFAVPRSRLADLRRTTTGADGRFELPHPDPASPALLGVSCAGFVGAVRELPALAGEPVADIVLELRPGRAVHGCVRGPDGMLVAGALVTVEQSWRAEDYSDGAGAVLTDADGEFAVGVGSDAEWCTLAVEAPDLGRDVFRGVVVDRYAELRRQPRATLRGRVVGAGDGERVVEARGELPDPEIPVFRTGWRRSEAFRAAVEPDGSYTIADLQPGLGYTATLLLAAAPGNTAPDRIPPTIAAPFTPAPGEVVERDFVVAAPIVVTGRVLTQRSRRPVGGVGLQVERDGVVQWEISAATDAEGRYEMRLATGAGRYRFTAMPRSGAVPGAVDALAAERTCAGGERVELDLDVPEPTMIPLRVVAADGAPVASIRFELSGRQPDGRGISFGDSRALDADGRGALALYGELGDVLLAVQRFPDGPRAVVRIELTAASPLLERTIELPRACAVAGSVHGVDGAVLAEITLTVRARYADGTSDAVHVATDRDGRFTTGASFRAAAATWELEAGGLRGGSPAPVVPPADGPLDLGALVLRAR